MHKKVKNTKRLWLGLKNAKADVDTAKFWFYHGKTSTNMDDIEIYRLRDGLNILKHPKFDTLKKTVLYLHGYIENPEVESIHLIADSYIQRGDHNILILDWSELADGNYLFDAVPNTRQLGVVLGGILLEMLTEGLEITKFHVVGHSLGGQLAGIIGRTIIEKSQGAAKLKRISALDPAFPPFYPGVLIGHLSKTDAEFVDVIHTDAWLYGAPVSTGTVDFWPNSGKTLQPGCPKRNYQMLTDNDLCSHRRSWRFWAESVSEKNRPSFHSVKGNSWKEFTTGRLIDKDVSEVLMGIDCNPGITGNYYLQTNGELPFSKGVLGTKYIEVKKEK